MHTPESYYFGALKRALEGDLEGAFSLQEKAEEAREAYGYSFSEAVSDDFPFVEEAVTTLLSSYDFTRCVRPDGSAYGTRGKCRKGSQQEKESHSRNLRPEHRNHPLAHELIKQAKSMAKEEGIDLNRLHPKDWESHASRAVSGGGYGGSVRREAENLVALAGSNLRDPRSEEYQRPARTKAEKPSSERRTKPSGVERHLTREQRNNPLGQALVREAKAQAKADGVDLRNLKPGDWKSHAARAISGGGYGGSVQREAENLVALASSSLRNPKLKDDDGPPDTSYD